MKTLAVISLGLAAAIILALAINLPGLQESLRANQVGLHVIGRLLEPGTDQSASRAPESPDCRTAWYKGFEDYRQGRQQPEDNSWAMAIECDPQAITWLHRILPQEEAWAVFAARIQPQVGESWFWLADLRPEKRVEYYQLGLELAPRDGLRWTVLGDLLSQEGQLDLAILAYGQACANGDPGFNGCWRAGQTAERIGEIETAIHYYELSNWAKARSRARELNE